MGGEPTFVSIDDYQSAEWNIASVGPTKRILADNLVRRLRELFRAWRLPASRPGQVVSGRAAAALGILAVLAPRRRADLAQCRNVRGRGRHACGNAPMTRTPSPSMLPSGSASRAQFVQPAYEDPADRMVKEGELPENIDPADPKIDDPQERARIMRAFESRLTEPAGYVLPVQRWTAQAAHRTGSAKSGARGAVGCS